MKTFIGLLLFLAGINQILADTLYFKPKDDLEMCPDKTECPKSKGCCTILGGRFFCCDSENKPDENVICPGGGMDCPDGNTCCKLTEGYGCCPLPNAVCCSDHVHCCPQGYTCDTSEGKCLRGNIVMNWFSKTKALPKKKSDKSTSVVCPGGTSSCPDGSTCCKLNSGKYGCCPVPNAVCCSDGQHCCPHGYTCNSEGLCIRGSTTLDWFSNTEASYKEKSDKSTSVVCPGGTSSCPDGSTCCKLNSGKYGCCPVPNAVCCSDGQHCCPHGYTCNSGMCTRGSTTLDWFSNTEASYKEKSDKSTSVVCPGGTSSCPDGSTCCKLNSGKYGCCPVPNAVCCSDGQHCCPHGYTCNSGMCTRGSTTLDWFSNTEASYKDKSDKSTSVVCPGGTSSCPDGSTCCKLNSGKYGCCPVPNAVCCSDGQHCCPHGYTCNTAQGTCSKGSTMLDWFSNTEASNKEKPGENAVCPDQQTECPTGNTCCKMTTGQYACCPLPNAVCCSDHIHCCPQGTQCNVAEKKCLRGNTAMDWFLKKKALKTEVPVGDVQCPDGISYCATGSTCCKLTTGSYGCCPLPNAVCCSDEQHCCPQYTICDLDKKKCRKGNIAIDWFQKMGALKSEKPAENVICPDGKSSCQDGNTCCKLATGGYGCCPMPNAVCCSDHQHCCPHNTKCDVRQGKCLQGDSAFDWFLKTQATEIKKPAANVICPDGKSSCEGGSTCCELATGGYGCCPMPNAVCCSDHQHCCPHNTKCAVSQGKCLKGDVAFDWFLKTQATEIKKPAENVICPDGKSSCEGGSTCCELATRGYGCCPMPNAVCCSDHQHCCPHNTKCAVSQGKCLKGDVAFDWFLKTQATEIKNPAENVICPDKTSVCPADTTCCELATGKYGCCPQPDAVCCSDHLHCCPKGMTCDVAHGKCLKENIVTDWLLKTEALTTEKSDIGIIRCKDKRFNCSSSSTCCRSAKGYGCCPMLGAVCCDDLAHCCPPGTTCDSALGKCALGTKKMDWLSHQPAATKLDDVICPDQSHECPTGTTCCKLKTGSYGCCPYPDAVCCKDGKHCCPNKTRCDMSRGRCIRENQSDTYIEMFFTKINAP